MNDKESTTVILARVSSKAQEDEGYSLDSQLKLLHGYCQQRDLRVVRVFNIAETASKQQSRKVFHELLTYLNKEKIFHLAVEKTDRLTRNFRDAVAIDEWLEKDSRRRLHAVKENLLLHKEAKSDVKFMWNIHLSVAKKYTDNLREEAMKGWAEKLAQGWLPSPPPPGYMTATVNGKKIHVPDPDTKALIVRVFEYYLEPGQSIETTAQEMMRLGIRTRMGRPYYKSQVQKILNNPFYIGINRFNGKEYPGAQQPILSKTTFDLVQTKMTRKTAGRYRRHNPTLKNVIRCSHCDSLVTWQLQKGHYYGACKRKLQECKAHKLLRQDAIEKDIQNLLNRLVSPREEVIDWVADEMRRRHRSQTSKSENIAQSIQLQIDRIERMLQNLYDDKLAGEITAERYAKKKEELTSQKQELEAQLANADLDSGKRLEQKIVLFRLSQKSGKIYTRCTPEQKRLIISKLFDEITYKGGVVSVKYTKFTQAIAENVLETHKILGGIK